MKIIQIIEDTTTAVQQPAATPIRKFQSLDTLNKDPNALVNTWAPRLTQLQARCNSMLARLIAAAGPQWAKKLAKTTINVRSTDQYVQANAQARNIIIDITVFWDAPDATLAVAIGHELGHIALGHVNDPATAAQSRQDEFNADDFGIRLAKLLGYNTAELFKFMHNKQDYDFTNTISRLPNSTHPTYDQRIDRAKKQGFELSRGGQQQIQALQQHLA